jgi:osmotically-inducible protein OsmY
MNLDELSDDQLRNAVIAALDREPQISTTEIGVTASEGVVTLTGYVDTVDASRLAEQAAKQVSGVRGLANELAVKPFTLLTDTDLAKNALQVLESETGLERLTVTVDDGWLTLEGEVAQAAQKEGAATLVQDLLGVRGVTNLIQVCSA